MIPETDAGLTLGVSETCPNLKGVRRIVIRGHVTSVRSLIVLILAAAVWFSLNATAGETRTKAEAVKANFYVAVGGDDSYRAKQIQRFYDALRQANVPCELHIEPGMQHQVNPRPEVIEKIYVFFDKYLKLSGIDLGQGQMAGEPTATSIVLQSRLTKGRVLVGGDLPDWVQLVISIAKATNK